MFRPKFRLCNKVTLAFAAEVSQGYLNNVAALDIIFLSTVAAILPTFTCLCSEFIALVVVALY